MGLGVREDHLWQMGAGLISRKVLSGDLDEIGEGFRWVSEGCRCVIVRYLRLGDEARGVGRVKLAMEAEWPG